MFPLIPDSGVPLNLTAAPTRSAEKEIKRDELNITANSLEYAVDPLSIIKTFCDCMPLLWDAYIVYSIAEQEPAAVVSTFPAELIVAVPDEIFASPKSIVPVVNVLLLGL